MTKRNRDLFYKIADAIEQTHRWSQDDFVRFEDADEDGRIVHTLTTVEVDGEEITCGTSHCVAGWAVVIAKPELLERNVYDINFRVEATKLLGLNDGEAWMLFCDEGWIDGRGELDRDAWQEHPDDDTVAAAAQRLREIGDGAPVRFCPEED